MTQRIPQSASAALMGLYAQAPLARRIPDACRALGVGKSTIYKMASEGKVKLVHIAGRTVVPESEIIRLASGDTGPQISPQQSAGLRRSRADILGRSPSRKARIP